MFVGSGVSVGAAGVSVTGNVRKTGSVTVGTSVVWFAEHAERKNIMARKERRIFL